MTATGSINNLQPRMDFRPMPDPIVATVLCAVCSLPDSLCDRAIPFFSKTTTANRGAQSHRRFTTCRLPLNGAQASQVLKSDSAHLSRNFRRIAVTPR